MNDQVKGGVHWSFWVIGGITLIWNLLGVMSYFAQMNPDALAAMPEGHQALIEGRPAWATGAFAIAVFGGALGCLLLLLRKSVAYYLFTASLLGIIVQMTYNLGIADTAIDYGPFDVAMIILIPAVAVFLIWYSNSAQHKGWIS